jgi:hypothetical protein
MGMDDLETEFFGSRRRSSRPSRSERARAKREQRAKREPLRSSDPGQRVQAATALVEEGTDANATVLLDFARAERNTDVRTAVARAVLAAPVGPDPNRPEAKLRDWALAEATRHGAAPPADGSPSSSPPPLSSASPAADAPARPATPVPVSGRIPAVVSPDDRWRTGGSTPPRPPTMRPAPRATVPAPAAVPKRPVPPNPGMPEPVAASAAPPAIVGGTVGNGVRPAPATRQPDAPSERTVPAAPVPAAPVPKEAVPAAPVPDTQPRPQPAAPEPTDAATPGVTPGATDEAARPSTWRVVKAHPVDIVVWGPADASSEPANGTRETAQPSPSAAR